MNLFLKYLYEKFGFLVVYLLLHCFNSIHCDIYHFLTTTELIAPEEGCIYQHINRRSTSGTSLVVLSMDDKLNLNAEFLLKAIFQNMQEVILTINDVDLIEITPDQSLNIFRFVDKVVWFISRSSEIKIEALSQIWNAKTEIIVIYLNDDADGVHSGIDRDIREIFTLFSGGDNTNAVIIASVQVERRTSWSVYKKLEPDCDKSKFEIRRLDACANTFFELKQQRRSLMCSYDVFFVHKIPYFYSSSANSTELNGIEFVLMEALRNKLNIQFLYRKLNLSSDFEEKRYKTIAG